MASIPVAESRAAAVKLSSRRQQPSEGLRLLEALSPLVATAKEIPSLEIVTRLAANEDSEWCDFRGHGPITQKQVSTLLEPYDVFPDVIHPVKGSSKSVRGYKCAELRAVIARFFPSDPNNRTTKGKKPK